MIPPPISAGDPAASKSPLIAPIVLQCKHLLAVIIAHKLNKEVKTSVRLQGVVDLLGLNRVSEEEAGVNVEGGAAGFHENLAGAWV